MKKLTSKIPAMIGIGISVISFILVISAFILAVNEPEVSEGVSRSFALWIYSVITAMISLLFYVLDAFVCIKEITARCQEIFNTVLVVLIFGSIPMVIFVGGGLGINILIWNLYYLLMFVLEAISVVRHIKENRR